MYKKILIINLGGIGDFLLSTPALRALALKYPEAEIDLLCGQGVADTARRFSYIRAKFIFWPIISCAAVLTRLRAAKYDLAVNMRTMGSIAGAFKIRLLLAVISADKTCGRNTNGRGGFFDIKIAEPDIGIIPEMEYDLAAVKALGVQTIDRAIEIHLQDTDHQFVSNFLNSHEIPGDRLLIGVHPGGKPSHRWPLEYFAAVMKHIHNTRVCDFVITGNMEEKFLAENLETLCGFKLINACGAFPDIYQTAAIIQRCGLYICNDTGTMHIAAVLKIPLAAIFGPGYLARYDPRAIFPEAVVLFNKQKCAPCTKQICASARCLKTIQPQQVIESLERVFT